LSAQLQLYCSGLCRTRRFIAEKSVDLSNLSSKHVTNTLKQFCLIYSSKYVDPDSAVHNCTCTLSMSNNYCSFINNYTYMGVRAIKGLFGSNSTKSTRGRQCHRVYIFAGRQDERPMGPPCLQNPT